MKDISIVPIVIGLILLVAIITLDYTKNEIAPLPPQPINCNEDSLRNVISELENEIEMDETGWDSKERRYEDIIFEYEYGIEHLKHYHPEAYRDFHRIISYKERFSKQDEKDNIKRLKIESHKW